MYVSLKAPPQEEEGIVTKCCGSAGTLTRWVGPATFSCEVRKSHHVCFGAKAGETQDVRKHIQYGTTDVLFYVFMFPENVSGRLLIYIRPVCIGGTFLHCAHPPNVCSRSGRIKKPKGFT